MARIRARDWGTEGYWRRRIQDYLDARVHPGEALAPRVAFVCIDGKRVAGLVAGHLTRRFSCSGELEWISVRAEYRGRGVASQLLRRMAKWFVAPDAIHVCVDVEPKNEAARKFYARHGAKDLKPHWMVWDDIRAAISAPKRPSRARR